jgi:hypothetical protein
MKQIIKFLAIVAMSAAIALSAGYLVLRVTQSGQAFFAVFFFGAILIALAMGAFDVKDRARYESIKHRKGITTKAA